MNEKLRHIVYLALGTNLGERISNLNDAIRILEGVLSICRYSPVYETPPWGYLEQPSFLNQVLEVETDLSPRDLHLFTRQVETQIGRAKTFQYGPRKIDIDILFYDNVVMESPELTIPHPRIEGRGFVLMPMADLVPELIHPVSGKTILQLCREADYTGIVRFDG